MPLTGRLREKTIDSIDSIDNLPVSIIYHSCMEKSIRDGILIASITPYFLDREFLWFQENIKEILEARKTQSFFQDNTVYLKKDGEINFSQFLRQLDEMGYERVQEVSDPGELSRRGGIVDIFPINLNYAVKIEFFGNKIEGMEKLPIVVENEKEAKERIKKKLKRQKMFMQLGALKLGDLLVHLDHGVGRFAGISYLVSSISDEKKEQDTKYYVLEYAAGDKLYIPVGLERKLSRYVGFATPKISRLSSPVWVKTKGKIKEETEKLAKELLEIYAQREITNRPYYSPDNEIDAQLVNTFPYEETPDQIQAIEDIKKDLEEKEEPMDRIVCGDVGFGKTEVALRAMIKAVNNGYQAALICPTTILASQHYQTFIKRIGDLPIRVGLLSRLQSKNEQKKIIENLKIGKFDIMIGTHRILSNDVEFKNLGLLAIDDEQRFGVRQKEKLRKIRTSLDVLSLSATPIPRTLYLAMSSLKNISIIQTPPSQRLPIKTFVKPWSKEIIKKAIIEEISRGGQVYYLHNRVETIERVKKFLEKLLPKVKFGIVHGRVGEKYLVKVMDDFSNKKIDVLIATAIIENGLDLPNVNTLIAADSARLGLSQAYQIRGRIGRSHIQASAYFLYNGNLSDIAEERLRALEEAQELGSGYRIALKDMELRGAGNILGKEQSGNINHIGLNLYCQMLSDAIEKLKS
ncbi:MAG: DEAD/DEAH box helicase [Candidatus Nealsonbacteria bacterium]|nr:DEAD/DEAH box helicase [Candidatus Nealsonbacteria bacterium]